jgi:hypothetical protein
MILSIELDAKIQRRLKELAALDHLPWITDVLRRAIVVYDFLRTEMQNGSTVTVRHKDGTESDLSATLELAYKDTP